MIGPSSQALRYVHYRKQPSPTPCMMKCRLVPRSQRGIELIFIKSTRLDTQASESCRYLPSLLVIDSINTTPPPSAHLEIRHHGSRTEDVPAGDRQKNCQGPFEVQR